MSNSDLITDEWLSEVGFKWSQLERQPHKHWLLWLGSCLGRNTCTSDLGIEVSRSGFPGRKDDDDDFYFCWLRSDSARLYHRFIHIRHVKTRYELCSIIEGITGQPWDVRNNLYGCMHTDAEARRLRKELDRFDMQLLREDAKWSESEKVDNLGGALPEHLDAYISTKRKD